GRPAGDADPRRRRPPVRRLRRPGRVSHRAGLPGEGLSRVLVPRHRRAPHRRRAVRARRHPRHLGQMATSALETDRLCKSFGALTVADNISFRLEPGARHALIGPNGAGKTTFVNMLTGRILPTSGRILLAGEEITKINQSARVRRGLGRTFQVTTLFRSLPVLDNVALGIAERDGVSRRMWKPASRHDEITDEAMQILGTLGLADD